MDAYISGRNGVAVVVHEDRYASMAVKDTDVVPRVAADSRLLLDPATEVQYLGGTRIEKVAHVLGQASSREDALHLALMCLDRRLSSSTREAAADALNEAIAADDVLGYLRSILYATPMPLGTADLEGAVASCLSVGAIDAQRFFEDLADSQVTIAAVRQAWLLLPVDGFGGEDNKKRVEHRLIDAGVFYDMAHGAHESWRGALRQLNVDSFPVEDESDLYVERKCDADYRDAIAKRPLIVLVKGASQMGKTSLLVRGRSSIEKMNVRMVYADLKSVDIDSLPGQKELYIALSNILARSLDLEFTLADVYDDRVPPNKNLQGFLFDHVLSAQVVWIMDGVDRLFELSYYSDVFSMMRSWYNERWVYPQLANLTVVLSYAAETHLLIEDAHQSPFNVGEKVELQDLTPTQIHLLSSQARSPIQSDTEVSRFGKLVGGHPHLVCRGLLWMAEEHKTLDEFTARAAREDGPFGDHLRKLLSLLDGNGLRKPMVQVLRTGRCGDEDFLKLRSAGVVMGSDPRDVQMRCGIYRDFLRNKLLAA